MKVTNIPLVPLQEQKTSKSAQKTSTDFSSLLTEHMEKGAAGSASFVQEASIDRTFFPLLETGNLELNKQTSLTVTEKEELASKVDDILSLFEEYQQMLLQPRNTVVREASTALSHVEKELAALQSNPLLASDPVFSELQDGLQAMATSERFKLNRGDYM